MGTALLTEFNRYFAGTFYIFSPPKKGVEKTLCTDELNCILMEFLLHLHLQKPYPKLSQTT